MLIQYDIPKINKVLNDFYTATGTRIDLFDNSFTPVSCSQHEICNFCNHIQKDPACQKDCIAFDRMLLEKSKHSQKNQQDYCPFGLLNIVSPIFYNDNILGYLFFGQMKTNPDFPDNMHGTDASLRIYYDALETFSPDQSQSIASLAQIVIGYLLTENMLKPDTGEIVTKAEIMNCAAALADGIMANQAKTSVYDADRAVELMMQIAAGIAKETEDPEVEYRLI
jgi:ligand-binding sensor protein